MNDAIEAIRNIDTCSTTTEELWETLKLANEAGISKKVQGCDFVKEKKNDMIAVIEGLQNDIAYKYIG